MPRLGSACSAYETIMMTFVSAALGGYLLVNFLSHHGKATSFNERIACAVELLTFFGKAHGRSKVVGPGRCHYKTGLDWGIPVDRSTWELYV